MRKRTPYSGLPDRQFWKKDPGVANAALFDPVSPASFSILPDDQIMTAGSCFAQHVARYVRDAGYNYLLTERAHPVFPEELAKEFNYGTFTARYGNVYTCRQLKQLLLRAYGLFEPIETAWTAPRRGNNVVDPFRPQIQPGGFVSEQELLADRAVHFKAVRDAIEATDVFVFTLGLTECWVDRRDGAVFPLAPGVAGGEYDESTVAFANFDLQETTEDLLFALNFIREKNPGVKIILTVSPVPLNATFEDRHVFVSTTVSKAVLRLAAEAMLREFDDCVYFPSYEIITAPHVRGRYFGPDAREVVEAGVSHVMSLFFKHFLGEDRPVPEAASALEPAKQSSDDKISAAEAHIRQMQEAIDVLCDEEAIDNR